MFTLLHNNIHIRKTFLLITEPHIYLCNLNNTELALYLYVCIDPVGLIGRCETTLWILSTNQRYVQYPRAEATIFSDEKRTLPKACIIACIDLVRYITESSVQGKTCFLPMIVTPNLSLRVFSPLPSPHPIYFFLSFSLFTPTALRSI